MRPGVIKPSDMWPGSERHLIGPPEGMDEAQVHPVEAITDRTGPFGHRFCIAIELEPGDLEVLATTGRFWLVLHGGRMQPFGVALETDRR